MWYQVILWHGQNRTELESELELGDEDDETIKVVVTSYGILVSEHAKKSSAMFNSAFVLLTS